MVAVNGIYPTDDGARLGMSMPLPTRESKLTALVSAGDAKGVRAWLDEAFWSNSGERPGWEQLKIALQKEDRDMTRLLCAWGAAPGNNDLIELQHSSAKYPQYIKAMRAAGLRNLPPPDAYVVPGVEIPGTPSYSSPAPGPQPDPLAKLGLNCLMSLETAAKLKEDHLNRPLNVLKPLKFAHKSIKGDFNMAANTLTSLDPYPRSYNRPKPPAPSP